MTDPFDNENKDPKSEVESTPSAPEQGHSETPETEGYTADSQAISGDLPESPPQTSLKETLQSQPAPPESAAPSLPPPPPYPHPRAPQPPQAMPPGFAPQQAPPPPPQAPPQGPPPVYGQPQQPAYQPQGMPPFVPPARSRNRWIPLVVGLVIVTFMLIMGGVALLVGGSTSSSSSSSSSGLSGMSFMGGQRVAVLEVEGVIGEGVNYPANTKVLVDQVKKWTENKSIRAMVIRVNSPGGAVSATQDLYEAVMNFKKPVDINSKPRPVVISMGDIAASGGYYTAMAGDVIYANSGTLTGSIGVIMSFYDYQEFQDMIGIKPRAVKSGEFKDMGSGSRAMTEREKALLQETIDDVYNQFFDSVVTGRSQRVKELLNATDPGAVTEEEIRESLSQYCDGRIFSGNQAYSYGMIDSLGTLDDAVKEAIRLAGISPDSTVIRGPVKPTGLFGSLGSMANKMETFPTSLQGTARFEYRYEGW